MARRKHPVSTSAILREIRKAQAKLRGKRKTASAEQREAIDLELRMLERGHKLIGDVEEI